MERVVSDNRNNAEDKKKEESVNHTGYRFEPADRCFQTGFRRNARHASPRLRFAWRRFSHNSLRNSRNREEAAGSNKFEQAGAARRKSTGEHSYLYASCPFGQAIFVRVVGDDGIRPAANQHKQAGDSNRSHSATVGLSVGAMNGKMAAILSSGGTFQDARGYSRYAESTF
jgi:hypothetical protein